MAFNKQQLKARIKARYIDELDLPLHTAQDVSLTSDIIVDELYIELLKTEVINLQGIIIGKLR